MKRSASYAIHKANQQKNRLQKKSEAIIDRIDFLKDSNLGQLTTRAALTQKYPKTILQYVKDGTYIQVYKCLKHDSSIVNL